ncbi:autotransporter outer membrane beta-barrel domain-containing protein, partial [Helicobacter cholecystus]|uniref:autotransporter outer membrane beta-barrel domain-containing protein n=1 Tax=Helicobacter cholecystus TaxID=45498 RepID=UPI00273989F1
MKRANTASSKGGGDNNNFVSKVKSSNKTTKTNSFTRPLIASSLALMLSASYAVAQDVNENSIENIDGAGEYNFTNDGTVTGNITLNSQNGRLLITNVDHKLTINGTITAQKTGSGNPNKLSETKGIIIQAGSIEVKGELNTQGAGGMDSRTTILLSGKGNDSQNTFSTITANGGFNVIAIEKGNTKIQQLSATKAATSSQIGGFNYIIEKSGNLTIDKVTLTHNGQNIIGIGYDANIPESKITFDNAPSTDSASLTITTLETQNDGYGSGKNSIYIKGNSNATITNVTAQNNGENVFELSKDTTTAYTTTSTPALNIITLTAQKASYSAGKNTITANSGIVKITDVKSINANNKIELTNAQLDITSLTATSNGYSNNQDHGNTITLKTSSTANIGSIEAKQNGFTGSSTPKNTITLDDTSTLNVTGNITASSAGQNNITSSNSNVDGTREDSFALTLGNLITKHDGFSSGENTITSDRNIQITGYIDSSGTNGKNTISLNNTAKLEINGALKASNYARGGGKNIITADAIVIKGGIESSNGASNEIKNNASNTSSSTPTTFASTSSDALGLEVTGNIAAIYGSYGAGSNTITTSSTKITGDIIANGGSNIITLTGAPSNSTTLTLNNLNANHSGYGAGSNTLKITGSMQVNQSISSTGSSSNTITISKASSTSTTPAIALEIKEGIKANGGSYGGGTNTITIEGGMLKVAGNITALNNNYNNQNTNTITANNGASITGDIISSNKGKNSIYIKGTLGTASTPLPFEDSSGLSTLASLNGNIITNGGENSIVFDNAFWAPAQLIQENNTPSSTPSTREATNTGTLTTTNGVSNIVLRQGSSNPLNNATGVFGVNASGGVSNIVMDANSSANALNLAAKINYGGGAQVNLLFSSANNFGQASSSSTARGSSRSNVTDDFTSSNTTDITIGQVLGVTYYNGLKLSIADKTLEYGNESKSVVSTFGDLYRNADGSLLTLTTKRTTNADSAEVSGLLIGNITSLQLKPTTTRSDASSSKTHSLVLNENSALVGNVILEEANVVTRDSSAPGNVVKLNLEMKDFSKLVISENKSLLNTLTLNTTSKSQIDMQALGLDTLAQQATIIDLATNGGSKNNVNRNTPSFRALVIGSKTASTDTGWVVKNTSNQDPKSKWLYIGYVDANADQSQASLGGVKVNSNTRDSSTQTAKAYADRLVVLNAEDNSKQVEGELYVQLAYSSNTHLNDIHYSEGGTEKEGNIAVVTVRKITSNNGASSHQDTPLENQGVLAVKSTTYQQGFGIISSTLKAVETDESGKTSASSKDYITYFVSNAGSYGVANSIAQTAASSFATSLDIFVANFNSLNKRMGELRDNNHSQGAWGRIFGGSLSSDFGVGSKTGYVTVQAGYDYAFGVGNGASNYLGASLAYSHSSSKTNNLTNQYTGVTEGLLGGKLTSNLVEIGIYNAYVQDSGWYNDTIFKFDYISNSFTLDGTASGHSVSTNNFGVILSDEFGYRFKLGAKQEWYIDPQAELSFGYVNASSYTQTAGDNRLEAKAKALINLKGRFGASFGYDFKNFTEGKNIQAKAYVGIFAESDYVNGGDVTLTENFGGIASLQSSIKSDTRAVMNLGTNIEIKDNTRIYFDFEKSFGGKINTEYQINAGVRYSFGEKINYAPEVSKSSAPLKVESKEETQKSESKEQESA